MKLLLTHTCTTLIKGIIFLKYGQEATSSLRSKQKHNPSKYVYQDFEGSGGCIFKHVKYL